jgi:predicted SnoaL-like aldol condensation-catalyzing enzyme
MSSCSKYWVGVAVVGFILFLAAPLALAADTDLAKNKALVLSFWKDVFIAKNVDAAPRYLRPDFVEHNPRMPPGLKGFQDTFRQAFAQTPANFKVEVTQSVAEGDRVVTYTQYSGTDPQGKPFTSTSFDMFRIQGGLIAEHWAQMPP